MSFGGRFPAYKGGEIMLNTDLASVQECEEYDGLEDYQFRVY